LLCFTFPFAFALRLCKDDLGPLETLLLRALVPITIAFALVGSTGSVLDIVRNFSSSGRPFSC
jgi:hypothetical protein